MGFTEKHLEAAAALAAIRIVPVLALQYNEDALFASRCVMVTTLMSVITLPAIILLLG